eukprot:g3376.t1
MSELVTRQNVGAGVVCRRRLEIDDIGDIGDDLRALFGDEKIHKRPIFVCCMHWVHRYDEIEQCSMIRSDERESYTALQKYYVVDYIQSEHSFEDLRNEFDLRRPVVSPFCLENEKQSFLQSIIVDEDPPANFEMYGFHYISSIIHMQIIPDCSYYCYVLATLHHFDLSSLFYYTCSKRKGGNECGCILYRENGEYKCPSCDMTVLKSKTRCHYMLPMKISDRLGSLIVYGMDASAAILGYQPEVFVKMIGTSDFIRALYHAMSFEYQLLLKITLRSDGDLLRGHVVVLDVEKVP